MDYPFYKLDEGENDTNKVLDKINNPGGVLKWHEGVIFNCPCGERMVYVAEPPHTIIFDSEGALTLNGSVGSHEDKSRNRKSNWCHFFIKEGNVDMCGDSECPGSNKG